jgi:hypothetical protein
VASNVEAALGSHDDAFLVVGLSPHLKSEIFKFEILPASPQASHPACPEE